MASNAPARPLPEMTMRCVDLEAAETTAAAVDIDENGKCLYWNDRYDEKKEEIDREKLKGKCTRLLFLRLFKSTLGSFFYVLFVFVFFFFL
jgi:hypothetical protein